MSQLSAAASDGTTTAATFSAFGTVTREVRAILRAPSPAASPA